MKTKKIAAIISFLSVSVIIAVVLKGLSLKCAYDVGGQHFTDGSCFDFIETKLQPIFWSFVPLLAISIILFFVRQEVFKAWVKFAIPGFVGMVALMFYAYSLPPLGGFMNWGDYDQLATLTLPPLFFLVSIIIIAKKASQIRNNPGITDNIERSTQEVTGLMRILKK